MSPLGAADPHREGPADLRLLLPALAVWATAAVTTSLSLRTDATVVLVAGAAGVLVLASTKVRAFARSSVSGGVGRFWGRYTAGAVLLCVAASAASTGLHNAEVRRGPATELARRYAETTLDLRVTTAPRRTRPRIEGDRSLPAAIVLDAQVRRIEASDGTVTRTRAPVLVLADAGATVDADADADADDHRGGADDHRGGPGGHGVDVRSGRGSGPEGEHGTSRARQFAWLELLPSTEVRVRARLAPSERPGDRVAAVVRVPGSARPEVVREPTLPQRFAGRMRAGLREATRPLPPDAAAVLPGLVVGDTSRMTPELQDAFRATDLTHVLAVSGANFTILLALLTGPPGTAARAERSGLAPRIGLGLRTTALLGGALTLGFVFVCGPEPSVLRAAACGSIALLALATGRRRSLLPALAAAVILLVLYDPWLARSYGFVLSVLATGSLLVLAPRWSRSLRRRGMPPRLAEALAAALAAQAACAPVVVVMAARVSLVAVPCNLLVELAVAPATVLGFGALLTAPLAMPLATFLAWCASWPVLWIVRVARTGAGLPGSGVHWPGGWGGALWLALLTVVLWALGRRLVRHPWICVVCAFGLALVVIQPAPLTRVITGWPPPGWRFAVCDVGQGDATVLAVGDGSGVVVDAGPDPVLADRCLRRLGISTIRLVVLTHFHADHVAGLPGLLRGRSVGAIETTRLPEPVDQAEFVHREAAARHIPVRQAVAGEHRRTGDLDWHVLWPPTEFLPEGANDSSVALLVRTHGIRLLLLGDLEPPGQRALLASRYGSAVGAVDVLKVAHHGSAYQDPALLRRARPRLALISVGERNSYGHPSPRTLRALREGGAQVRRTDENGALAVAGSGGAGLRVADGGW